MARYEHLPIYKQALDVAVHFERVVAGFSHYHKYTLGTELRQKSREIVGLIVGANSTRDKRPPLRRFSAPERTPPKRAGGSRVAAPARNSATGGGYRS